jgi:hypothetical protein
MNFSKDYIELAKDKRIQELRPTLNFDYFAYKKLKYNEGVYQFYSPYMEGVAEFNEDRGHIVWLPTSDQLDEEIIKICKKNKEYGYYFCYFDNDKWCAECYTIKTYFFEDINPLIAKIKLLIQLLECEK